MLYLIVYIWGILLGELVIESRKFIFLVNADERIGGGHLRRSLNLADELALSVPKRNIIFLHWSFDSAFASLIINYNSTTIDKDELINHLKGVVSLADRDLLIVDSDDLEIHSLTYQHLFRRIGVETAYFTVNSAIKYECDILINPSILALYQKYKTSPEVKCLFGPNYFIFGEQFRRIQKQPVHKEVDTIFINFGSADPMGYTLEVLKFFIQNRNFDRFKLKVVLGSMNHELDQVRTLVVGYEDRIEVLFDTSDMYQVMSDCQLAICSPGTTFWELTVLGIRSVILSSAQREKESAILLDKLGYANLLLHCDQDFTDKTLQNLGGWLKDMTSIAPNLSRLQELINPNGLKGIVQEILE
jgi:spore coat polysaccharide biosynthesis predicted glycosyltransferase SpsG